MHIKLIEDGLLLEESESLKPYQCGQLKFWGFTVVTETNSNLFFRTSDPSAMLIRIADFFYSESISYSLSEECKVLLNDLRSFRNDVAAVGKKASDFKDGIIDVPHFNNFQMFVRTNIKRVLRDHQMKAAYHLYLTRNAANFSVPGSGKTSVVLTVYEKLRLEGEVNLLFVVGPVSCFGPWKNEFVETLGRTPSSKVLAGGDKEIRQAQYFESVSQMPDLILTTFQTLSNDIDFIASFFRRRGVAPLFVVDEAHYIKQLNGVWANAVLDVSKLCPVRCALTGTPIPNRYTDIFNLSDFLWGKNNILSSEDKSRIDVAERGGKSELAKQIVKQTITPFFYRVRKTELGLQKQVHLPPHTIKMNKVERAIYDAIATKIRSYATQDYLKNIEVVHRLIRGRMMRLRQSVSYPKMIRSAIEGYRDELVKPDSQVWEWIVHYDSFEKPAKLLFLIDFVKEIMDRSAKVVVWSNFIETIELISHSLEDTGIENKYIYGMTPTESLGIVEEETRETIIQDFVDPKSDLNVLVANPAACAESISLHKTCSTAVYYDLSYNCAQYLQSLDRIHRVGGSEWKESYYHFLQYADTIDQDIKRSLDVKASRMLEVIDEDFAVYSLDMFQEDDEEASAYERMFRNG